MRQSIPLQDAKLECDIYRFAILTLLEKIEDFNDKVYFPWGPNSVTEFVEGAIEDCGILGLYEPIWIQALS